MILSIITVTKNNRDGLRQTAQSLKIQNCRDFEWIIIDGDSDDGSKADLKEYDAFHLSEKDKGLYDAMNKGIDIAKGEYLLFLNAGDILAEASTVQSIISAALKKPDFIFGDSKESDGVNLFYKKSRKINRYKTGMFTHHQAMIYRKDLVAGLRYDLDYPISADYKFTVQYLSKCNSMSYLPEALCIFRSGGLSQVQAASGRMEQFHIRREMNFFIFPVNHLIYGLQGLLWQLRTNWPLFYWRLKS